MVSLKSTITRVLAAVHILAHLVGGVYSADTDHELAARATPAAPHFVLYSDQWVSGENGPPDASVISVRHLGPISSIQVSL